MTGTCQCSLVAYAQVPMPLSEYRRVYERESTLTGTRMSDAGLCSSSFAVSCSPGTVPASSDLGTSPIYRSMWAD